MPPRKKGMPNTLRTRWFCRSSRIPGAVSQNGPVLIKRDYISRNYATKSVPGPQPARGLVADCQVNKCFLSSPFCREIVTNEIKAHYQHRTIDRGGAFGRCRVHDSADG